MKNEIHLFGFRSISILQTPLLCLLLILGLQSVSKGQTFENSIGIDTLNETVFDGKPLSKGYGVISNHKSVNLAPLSLMHYTMIDPNGDWVLTKQYVDPISKAIRFEGRAIESGEDENGKPVVYMAGNRTATNPANAIVLVAQEDGTPLVAHQQFSSKNLFEIATTLESIKGGFIVGGNAVRKGIIAADSMFFLARFKYSAGAKLNRDWSFRYGDSCNSPVAACMKYQIGKTCLGNVNNKEVVAVTGYSHKTYSKRHTFISCVDMNNGSELWRRGVISTFPIDEGVDIVQDPNTKNFLVVGFCQDANNRRYMFLVLLDQNGNFLTSQFYTPGTSNAGDPKPLNFTPKDVITSLSSKTAIIVGEITFTTGSKKTFALEIPFDIKGNPAPIWQKYYVASSSNSAGYMSVEQYRSPTPANAYFITTHSGKTSNFDIHTIGIDETGETGMHDCAVKKFDVKAAVKGDVISAGMFSEKTNWDNVPIKERRVRLPQRKCK